MDYREFLYLLVSTTFFIISIIALVFLFSIDSSLKKQNYLLSRSLSVSIPLDAVRIIESEKNLYEVIKLNQSGTK